MMMTCAKNEPGDLLSTLKKHQRLVDFNLTLYRKRDGEIAHEGTPFTRCGSTVRNQFSNEAVLPFLEKRMREIVKGDKPVVCRVHGGLLSFIVPYRRGVESFCLVGEGVREKSISILNLQRFCKARKADVFDILEQIEKLPVRTSKDVEEVAVLVHRELFRLPEGKRHELLIDKIRNRLGDIVRGLSRLDELKTPKK